MRSVAESEFVILGGGLAGLSAGLVLGERATVVEREARPGGLVRTEYFNGYWFDRVIHLLHFYDAAIQERVLSIVGDALVPCPSTAWVETDAGVARYPLQMNLRDLDAEVATRCIVDLAGVTFDRPARIPANFEEVLLDTFGKALCETFLFPYNLKVWKRPLHTLASSALQWSVTHPDFARVVRGAIDSTSRFSSYNASGWYPRPPADSPVRGMEYMTRRLAEKIVNLHLQNAVEEIDLDARRVVTRDACGETRTLQWGASCCSTLPLPFTIAKCRQAPQALKDQCARLLSNRVLTVMLSVRGSSPENSGHWRYYTDPDLIFNRLIFLDKFDRQLAPAGGWPVLVEITEPAETPLSSEAALIRRAVDDFTRCGAINGGEVIDAHAIVAMPAYVVFTPETEAIVNQAMDFLREHGVEPLGRYGRWEYSSMSQVMNAGFAWAEGVL